MAKESPRARERHLPSSQGRRMVRAGGGKKQLIRQTLEFRIKYGGWQKSAERMTHTSLMKDKSTVLVRINAWSLVWSG